MYKKLALIKVPPKAQASCSSACMCEESGAVQVSDSSKATATVTTEAVAADVICLSPPLEHSPGRFRVTHGTAAAAADVAEDLLLQPQESSAGPSVARTSQTVADIKNQWNLYQVFTELGTEEDCIVFCEERGLIPVTKKCTYHKRPMKLSTAASHGQLGLYRCHKSNCRTKPVPRAQGTWFENMHLALPTVFQMMYLFSHGASYEDVQREAYEKTGPVLSNRTISDWFSYCRETIVVYELDHQIYETKIGGPNKIVIIEQSKFAKRKYNKGKNLEGQWIIGMVGNGSYDIRLEVCPDKERTEDVLVPLIQKHVAEGSIIRTGSWTGYDCLENHGYVHQKSSPSGQDTRCMGTDGTHAHRTECHWKRLKRQFQKHQCKRDFLDWLAEFSWRQKNKASRKDPFEEFIKVIKYVYRLDQGSTTSLRTQC